MLSLVLIKFCLNLTLTDKGPIPFYQKVLLAGTSGALGGLVGTPGDMVNVRMQNDMKLPLDKRRKYVQYIESLTP